jgi:hypothetical protein
VHPATLTEVFTAFPARTPERQALNNALADCVVLVKGLRIADQIVLDGSYVTSKPDPSDIDMVVLTLGVYQAAGEQRFLAAGIDMALLHVQFAPDTTDFQGWLTFFSTDRALTSKGVVPLVY